MGVCCNYVGTSSQHTGDWAFSDGFVEITDLLSAWQAVPVRHAGSDGRCASACGLRLSAPGGQCEYAPLFGISAGIAVVTFVPAVSERCADSVAIRAITAKPCRPG